MDPSDADASSLRQRIAELERENEALRQQVLCERQEASELQASLRETQNRMRLVLDNIPLGVSLVSPENTVLMANKAQCAMFGRSPEEIVGRKCYKVYESREAPCSHCPGPTAMAARSPCEIFTRGVRDSGETFSVRIRALPVVEEGVVTGFLEIVEDLSEKEQAEHEKLLLAELIDNAEHIAVFKNTDLRYVSVNKAFLALIGFHDLREILGKTDAELFGEMSSSEQIEQYVENDRKALCLPRGETITAEEDTHAPDGSLRTFLTKKFPIYDHGDTLLGVATLTSEITRRKRMEEELKQANRQLKAFFENIPGHINVVDKSFTIIGVSRGLLDTFGLESSEEVIGRKCYEALQGRKTICHHCCLPQAFREGGMVIRYSTPEEEAITGRALKIYSAPIKDEEGRIIGGMEFVADISDLRALERQLIAAKEAAEAASKSKSEFLANMSHEIRTPLNGVLGMLQLLQETRLEGDQKEYVDTATSASKSLLEVINDILDISKIEAGKLELTEETFELAPLLEQVMETFSYQAREKHLQLDYRLAPEIPPALRGDSGRLRQILFNLVGNAVKFTEQGHVQVEVWPLQQQRAQEQGLRLLFRVRDSGTGIPEQDIARIFEPFTQKDASYTRKFQGTGLGLTIVRKLAELMGGGVSIDSALDKGTDVYFTLRVKVGQQQPHTEPKNAPQQQERSMRILLAEDNKVNQLVATKLLQRMGHHVVAVESGRMAVEALADEQYDLVLMDIQMPDMDGLEATRHIRSDTSGTIPVHIPIIAMTAHSMKGDQDTFLEAGMNAYIAKPVDMEELREVLAQIGLDG